jgi:hypothetical protein
MTEHTDTLARLHADIEADRRSGSGEAMGIRKLLLSKIERIVKRGADRPATENDVIEAANSYLKEVLETRDAKIKGGRPTDLEDRETAIVSAYLPMQMSDEELDREIENALVGQVRDKKAMGVVMKHLKEGFNGRYDARAANALVSAKLKG